MIRVFDLFGRAPSHEALCLAEICRRTSLPTNDGSPRQDDSKTTVIHQIVVLDDDASSVPLSFSRPRSNFELSRDIATALASTRVPVCHDCRAIDILTKSSEVSNSATDHAAVMSPCGWIHTGDDRKDDSRVSTETIVLDLDRLLDRREARWPQI